MKLFIFIKKKDTKIKENIIRNKIWFKNKYMCMVPCYHFHLLLFNKESRLFKILEIILIWKNIKKYNKLKM